MKNTYVHATKVYNNRHKSDHISSPTVSTKNQQTITTKLLTEFDKIAYVSGPLFQWVRLSYFSSMFQKYIIKVSNGLQTIMVVFFSTSRTQHN
jgi:hypothetical protein